MIRTLAIFLILVSSLHQAVAAPKPIDSIIAVVDEDIISQKELDARIEMIRTEFAQSNRSLPEPETLKRQMLEIMIMDSVLLQQAKKRGIKVTEGQLNQTMQNIARDNKMSLAGFRQALISNGIKYGDYRESLRKELTVNSLRQQYTARNSTITEAEVNDFIRRTADDSIEYEYRLSHILIALPDAAPPKKVSKALDTANQIMKRLDQGDQFTQLANEYSAGSKALHGGDLGWRKQAEIPGLFSNAVMEMEPGEFAGPFRSASGYHIVSLTDRHDIQQVLVPQTRSRHILIRSNDLISEEQAKKRLNELRKQILAGEDFGRLARLESVDYNSGAEGGDIGWMGPGETVAEYEAVTNELESGRISRPFRSQFGWHIVEVTGRRTVDETEESKRRKIESQLSRQKQREAFDIWKRRLRDEAYVTFPHA